MAELFFRCGSLAEKIATDPAKWEWEEEPHLRRRKAIMAKYPQIAKLTGYDPLIAVFVAVEVAIQFLAAYALRASPWWVVVVAAYIFGGFLNHSLGAAIHEIGHDLAFGSHRPKANRALGFFCNLPLIVPFSVSYKIYHADHHKYLLHETKDVDIPTRFEAKWIRSPPAKLIWLLFHAVIHAVRPFFKSPKTPSLAEIINVIVQISADLLILKYLGVKAFVYLTLGTLFGLGAHPAAGHFFSEHYSRSVSTMSYYGPLNFLFYNVGYHNEHHDFPNIPYRKLPEVRRIAAEYYDNDKMPHHMSWTNVMIDFVMDPAQGPHAHTVGFKKLR